MSNVYVVYWSGTGNTQEMAMAIADGAKEMVQRLPYGMLMRQIIEELKKAKALCIRLSVYGCRTVGRSKHGAVYVRFR